VRRGSEWQMWFWFLLLGTVALAWGNSSHAADEYSANIGPAWTPGGLQTCSDQASCNAVLESQTNWTNCWPVDIESGPNSPLEESTRYRLHSVVKCSSSGVTAGNIFWYTADKQSCESWDPVTGSCDAAECDPVNVGKRELLPFQPGTSIPSQGLCDTSTNCNAVPVDEPFCHGDTQSGTQTCTLEVIHTADACTLPESADLDNNSDGPKCASVGGNQLCKDPSDPNQGFNCGFYNDNYVCLGLIPDGDCIFLADGGMACGSNSGSPPAPDDGVTVGVPAPADDSLSDGSSTTNIYNSGTVANSSGVPTGGDGNTDPSGNPVDNDQDSGTGTYSGDCSTPPVCSGDAIQCAILRQTWASGCQDVGDDASVLANTGFAADAGDPNSVLQSDTIDLFTDFDSSGWLGAGACIVDLTVDTGIAGTITIPLSEWCPLFAFVGKLILAIAWFRAGLIVVGVRM
jgi:hypothetical protein